MTGIFLWMRLAFGDSDKFRTCDFLPDGVCGKDQYLCLAWIA
jgi:hypothetical protein